MGNWIDYSKYTDEELWYVKSHIKPDANPDNYNSFLAEFEKRNEQNEGFSETEERDFLSFNKKIVRTVGYLQLAAPLFIITALIFYIKPRFATPSWYIASILCLIALNAVAGYTLLKGKKEYFWLSILNQALQIPRITMGSFAIKYSGIGGVFLGISWVNSSFWDTVKFGFLPTISPGLLYQHHSQSLQVGLIAIDIIAIVFAFSIVVVSVEN